MRKSVIRLDVSGIWFCFMTVTRFVVVIGGSGKMLHSQALFKVVESKQRWNYYNLFKHRTYNNIVTVQNSVVNIVLNCERKDPNVKD